MPKATIAASASLSGEVDTGLVTSGSEIVGLQMPDAWTAADLTFQASYDGETYENVYTDDDNELVVQAAASRFIVLREDYRAALARVRFLMVRSGTAASPVTQAAEREIQILTK